jgi:hypothetical protein
MKELTDGIGVLRAIDAVGVDAYRPEGGPAYAESRAMKSQFKEEQKEIQLQGSGATWGGHWVPGDAPSQVTTWAVQALAKAGTLSIIGVYPPTARRFPLGMAMNKNLTLRMGNCPPSQVPAHAGGDGQERHHRAFQAAHQAGAVDERHRRLQGIRSPAAGLDQGRAAATNALTFLERPGGGWELDCRTNKL